MAGEPAPTRRPTHPAAARAVTSAPLPQEARLDAFPEIAQGCVVQGERFAAAGPMVEEAASTSLPILATAALAMRRRAISAWPRAVIATGTHTRRFPGSTPMAPTSSQGSRLQSALPVFYERLVSLRGRSPPNRPPRLPCTPTTVRTT